MPFKIHDIHDLLSPFLVTGLSGPELTETEREILSEAPPAGVILFGRNVESIGQLLRMSRELEELIKEVSGLTPLIMADHEGGRISVLAEAIGAPPSQMASCMPGSDGLLARITASTARRMRRCGLNLTLSPVADVASEPLNPVIGTRAFSKDPGAVSEAVRIAVEAIAGEDMLSCLKHFPGHGSTRTDSHLTLPAIGRTLEQLREVELPPFVAGIKAGADLVMTAHISPNQGDPPASLDPRIVTDLLRDELGFDGVIITDALEMAGALPDGIAMKSVDPGAGDKEESAVPAAVLAGAFASGNDLLLMSRPLEEVYTELAAHAPALETAFSGDKAGVRMEEAARRIEFLREKASTVKYEDGDVYSAMRRAEGDGWSRDDLFPKILGITEGFRGPVLPVFLGEGSDFESETVRRFIYSMLDVYRGSPQGGLSIEIRPVTGELFVYEPVLGPGVGRCLVILSRRPQPSEILRELSSGYDMVIAAERPWDAGHVPKGIPVMTTCGTYDAAAEWLGEALRGGWDPQKSV